MSSIINKALMTTIECLSISLPYSGVLIKGKLCEQLVNTTQEMADHLLKVHLIDSNKSSTTNVRTWAGWPVPPLWQWTDELHLPPPYVRFLSLHLPRGRLWRHLLKAREATSTLQVSWVLDTSQGQRSLCSPQGLIFFTVPL